MAKGSEKAGGKSGGKPVVPLLALTILAALAGGATGKLIAARAHAAIPASAPSEAAAPYAGDTELRELPPIVTNLAEPAEVRVRLQLAIVYPKKAVELPNVLAAEIADDVVAFMKTLSVSQLQGASGLQALREDLNDRARTRSEGKVHEVVIENLVVQ